MARVVAETNAHCHANADLDRYCNGVCDRNLDSDWNANQNSDRIGLGDDLGDPNSDQISERIGNAKFGCHRDFYCYGYFERDGNTDCHRHARGDQITLTRADWTQFRCTPMHRTELRTICSHGRI